MTTSIDQPTAKVTKRVVRVSLGAMLLLGCSPLALHAETSNSELAKEIAELKAQIKSLRGAVAETKSETKKTNAKVRAAERSPAPPPAVFAALPEGATPVFATADKKLQFGSLTITPGGFFAMESVSRTRTTGAGILTGFNNIPFNNSGEAHTNENRLDERQTRLAALVEAPISKSLLVSGYGEFDFLGDGINTNNIQAYSYVPRVRNLYATLDSSDYGFHVLAGQNWSLVTLNSKGITPRNEVTPPQIDAGFIPGFEFARLPQIRITKDFNKKLWLSLSAEASQSANINGQGGCGQVVSNNQAAATAVPAGGINGQDVITANAATGVATGNCVVVGTGGGLGQQGLQQQFTLNKVPDVVAKVAYEANLFDRDIHLEAFGLYRDLLTNVNYGTGGFAAPAASTFAVPSGYVGSSNQNTTGYGIGAGVIVPLIPRRLDFQISGLIGRGIGRYTASGLPDATVNGNGSLKALGAADALSGLTYHITPSFDLFAFGGFEQVNRDFSASGVGVGAAATQIGYGTTGGVNNYGCEVEGGTCGGQTHRIYQGLVGFNDKLYKGSFGEVRVGLNYQYTVRQLFAATTNANGIGTAAAPLKSARAEEQAILTSFRYYPFQ